MTEKELKLYDCVLVESMLNPHNYYVWLKELYDPEDKTIRLIARGTHDDLHTIKQLRQGVDHAD